DAECGKFFLREIDFKGTKSHPGCCVKSQGHRKCVVAQRNNTFGCTSGFKKSFQHFYLGFFKWVHFAFMTRSIKWACIINQSSGAFVLNRTDKKIKACTSSFSF